MATAAAGALRHRQDLDREAASAQALGERTVGGEDHVRFDFVSEGLEQADEGELTAGELHRVVEVDDSGPDARSRPQRALVDLDMAAGDLVPAEAQCVCSAALR